MTAIDIDSLCEGALVVFKACGSHIRGEVTLMTDNFVRVDWAGTKRYDILHKQSPVWQHLERR